MKKLLSLALALLLILSLAACGSEDPKPEDTSSDATPSSSDAISSSRIPSKEEPAPAGPVEDSDLSVALNTYMSESFGMTSWYPYINAYAVFKSEETYTATVSLTEEPYDYSLSLLMWKYFTGNNADVVTPIVVDAGAALGLDSLDLCLITEDLYKICAGDGVDMAYASLYAYNIPVYSYLASAAGVSEAEIMNNRTQLVGTNVANIILAGLQTDFSGSFTGLSMDSVNTIAYSAIANFKDVYISKISVLKPDGGKIGDYENRTSPS